MSPNRSSSSAFHCSSTDGGAATTIVFALLAQQQLARDQPRLDRLAETGVIGDEEVHAREPQRLAQRLHLVGVDLDPRSERRLEQVRVGRRDGAPPQRVEERRELSRIVEAARAELAPSPLPR